MKAYWRKKQEKNKEKLSHIAESDSTSSLDPKHQLEAAYERLLLNEGVDEAWSKKFFQQVRILVLGRSGAGKTTLIRLMVGKHGPQSVSESVAGVQDINKEFLYSSEKDGIPLFIHDSNGMDVKGQERVDEIKAFLDKHQKGDDSSERIHIIWYVISAIDPRCVEDGSVMEMIGTFKIPLLLIMTHNDYEKPKVTDSVVDTLLRGYGEEVERESVKNLMVKVGNDGVSTGANNELTIDETKRDTEGLKLVAKRTLKLMDKKLRRTWVAAQAVDIEAKLDESAWVIARYSRRALFTSVPRAIPLLDPLKLALIFERVMVIMCRMWVVPPQLKKALKETLLHKEGGCQVLRRIGEDMIYVAGLAIAVGATVATASATVATAGAALPALIVVLAATGVLNFGEAVPILVKTFALQVLATIMYVKCTQVVSSEHNYWKPGVSKEEYLKLCEEFALSNEYQAMLTSFAKRNYSKLDVAVRKKKEKGIIKSMILETYCRLLRDRPNTSLQLDSLFKQSPPADSDQSPAADHPLNIDQLQQTIAQDLDSTSSETEDDLDVLEL